MSNLQTLSATRVTRQMAHASPVAVLVFAVASFVAVAVLKTDFYTEVFSGRFGSSGALAMGVLIAAIVEGVRFSLLLTSARDFSRGHVVGGWLGLLASIAAVGYEWHEAASVATVHSGVDPLLMARLLRMLIIVGLVLELRLVLSLSGRTTGNGAGRRAPAEPTLNLNLTRNGNGAKVPQ